MSNATLLVIQGPDQGSRFDIGFEPIRLGRGTQNELRIVDTEISRQHAVIEYDTDHWTITDRNSSNGTFVNGRSISTHALGPGDQIQLGRTILLFSQAALEDSGVSDQINLISQNAADDPSRIVGQAESFGPDAMQGWSQAGANLQLLYKISEESVRPTSSIDELLKRILDHTLNAVGADRGCMLVTDSKTDKIEPRVVSQRRGGDVGTRMPISTSIVEYVINNGQGVRTSDAQHDSRFDPGASILKSGIREAMCVPMHGRFELMGVIYVDTTSSTPGHLSASRQNLFNDQLLRLLLAIGRQSALAIENFRFQEALVTAERLAAMGQTIAILSHHIKNIMQGVRGGGYLIDMGLKDGNDDLVRKGWGIVDRNQERILNLVMDMLTFSKERQPELVSSRVEEVIQDVCDLMQTRIDDSKIQLNLDIQPNIPVSMFDPEGFHRVVLNILTNAIEAFQDQENDHRQVTIRAGYVTAQSQMWIEIDDNGPGIDQSDLASLFNLFESDKGARGTGLGLAVSRKILLEHGGDILVKSAPGAGACFRLEWPYQEDDSKRSDPDMNISNTIKGDALG